MNRKLEVLRDLSFGSEVAEYDTDLRRYFVRTDSFTDIINDRHDLVLGAKGTGKSAIFQMLIDEQYPLPELGTVIVVPAFDADDGSVLRRMLLQHSDLHESAFHLIWKSYIASLAGNYLATNDLADKRLVAALREANLLTSEKGAIGAWRKALDGIRTGLSRVAVKGEVELTPGILPGVKAKLGVDKPVAPPADDPGLLKIDALVQVAIESVVNALTQIGYSLWVCFDRLDEFFADDPNLERLALRALLRTHSDLRSLAPHVRLKLFLRNDILTRITRESGFVNLTHLRVVDLKWSRDDITTVVADRAWQSPKFQAFFNGGEPCPEGDRPRSRDVVGNLLPTRMAYYTRDVKPGFIWAVDQMMDGTRSINPRNVLALMSECRKRQIEAFVSSSPRGTPGGDHLISGDTLKRAVVTVGRRRIIDTLYPEHNSLRDVIERFRFGPRVYNLGQLTTQLNINPDDAYATIRDLDEAGFLQRSGPDQWIVASLYAAALDIIFGGPID